MGIKLMSVDEFLYDYRPSLESIVKSFKYVPKDVKARIEDTDPDIRNGKDYEDVDFRAHELTMSCDREEAIEWMKHWSIDAICYGIETKDLKWKSLFLATYDIYERLDGGRCRM